MNDTPRLKKKKKESIAIGPLIIYAQFVGFILLFIGFIVFFILWMKQNGVI